MKILKQMTDPPVKKVHNSNDLGRKTEDSGMASGRKNQQLTVNLKVIVENRTTVHSNDAKI